MQPTFHDPVEQAIYRNLVGPTNQPSAAQAPTPACMPKRRPARHGSPRPEDIARAEGIDLGDLSRLAARAPRGRTRRRRPRTTSVQKAAFDLITHKQPRLPRADAYQVARQWAQVATTAEEVTAWISTIGWERPDAVRTLRLHKISADMLNTPIAGTAARTHLRNGESIDGIIAALRTTQPRNTP